MKVIPKNKYDNDGRWKDISIENRKQFTVPNPFLYIIEKYFFKIPQLERINSFIETGTHLAETSKIFSENLNKVYTVEKFINNNNPYNQDIDFKEHYRKITQTHPNIEFYLGDTVKFLADILAQNSNETFIILLDAHDANNFSPILDELDCIKNYSGVNDHVIILDDGLDFGTRLYPTLDQVISKIHEINPNYHIENTQVGRSTFIAF